MTISSLPSIKISTEDNQPVRIFLADALDDPRARIARSIDSIPFPRIRRPSLEAIAPFVDIYTLRSLTAFPRRRRVLRSLPAGSTKGGGWRFPSRNTGLLAYRGGVWWFGGGGEVWLGRLIACSVSSGLLGWKAIGKRVALLEGRLVVVVYVTKVNRILEARPFGHMLEAVIIFLAVADLDSLLRHVIDMSVILSRDYIQNISLAEALCSYER